MLTKQFVVIFAMLPFPMLCATRQWQASDPHICAAGIIMFGCHLVDDYPLTSEGVATVMSDTTDIITWCHLALAWNLLRGCDDTLIC